MEEILIYPAGTGDAAAYAADILKQHKIAVTDHPTPDATHLLLDVPTKEVPAALLEQLPEKITIVGGNLKQPEIGRHAVLDLLCHEEYLAANAAITAECALQVAAENLDCIISGSSVLILGWGRIGKCLAALLKAIGCDVTVAARKETDRAILEALGYRAADPARLKTLQKFTLVYNTVPGTILTREQQIHSSNVLKIDLASCRGLAGDDVIWARGLPGRYAPKSSGQLIADIFLKEVMK